MDENSTCEQLEEGEIVDDDDFENISDNSISDAAFGKSVSHTEHLRALSLSSESELDRIKSIRHKRKLLHRKSKIKHKRHKKIKTVSDSSDSDVSRTHDLKGKLKEAIHISGIEGGHKNTLEIRLKAMCGLGANPTASAEPQLDIKTKAEEEGSEKIDDTELENLRMEALKTAVMNKCLRRKRKKSVLEGQETVTPLQTQENKENNTPKNDQNDILTSEKVGTVGPNNDVEEDEDKLRATLLAGLLKKKQTPKENNVQVKQITPKLPIRIMPGLPKRPVTKFKSNNLVNKQVINKKIINKQIVKNKIIHKTVVAKPQVKPLIINVNGDSDSEEESKQIVPNTVPQLLPEPAVVNIVPSNVPDLKAITNNVEKFLKEQRAKFETESQQKTQFENRDKTILEKSAVKLLPKSQQMEYQELLMKLKNAEKRKKARKLALQHCRIQTEKLPPKNDRITIEVDQKRSNINLSTFSEETVESKVEVIVQPTTSNSDVLPEKESTQAESSCDSSQTRSSKDTDSSANRKSGIINELTTLQRTLKQIKMQRNGSLQIRSKYQVLTPIIRKITETSNDRKKQEHRIKVLLQQLNEAKSQLSESHQRFSTLVRELVAKKEQIDKSCQEPKSVEKRLQNGKIINTKAKMLHKKIEGNFAYKKDTRAVPVTSTPIKSQPDATDEASISTFVTSSTNNDCEDMDVCNSDETDVCQIDIVDPNDIDQIFKRKAPVKSAIPEYVSPLNYNAYERYTNVDPLGIMCPYEVNGSCRDIDCTYKHYLKNGERR